MSIKKGKPPASTGTAPVPGDSVTGGGASVPGSLSSITSVDRPSFFRGKRSSRNVFSALWRGGHPVDPEPLEMPTDDQLLHGLGAFRIPPSFFLPVIGKATLAAYRSRGSVMRERWRLMQAKQFLIHPYSNFRQCWLHVTAILTVVNIYAIPVGVSFYSEKTLVGSWWLTFNFLCDAVFSVDIYINFITAHIVDNIQSLNVKRIRIKYLKTWFAVDLLALIPLDYLLIIKYVGTGLYDLDRDTIRIFNTSRILSMLRLLRVSRLLRYSDYLEEIMDFTRWGLTGFMSLIYTFLVMLSIMHWASCFSFLISKINGFSETSWVQDINIVNMTVSDQYMWSLFRTMSHMLTVAYATIQLPKGPAELWLTCSSLLIGTALYFSILSRITALVYGTYDCKRMYKSKYEQCELYMASRHIPNRLQTRIRNHLYFRFQGKWFDEEEILQDMSESLRQEVMHFNCHRIVTNVPFFNNSNIINAVIKHLKFEVFQSHDVIFRKGSIARKMYMIDAGVIALDSAGLIRKIKDGEYFGELCLLGYRIRTVTAKALTPSKLYSLSVDSFKSVQDQYPDLKVTVESEPSARVH